MRLSTKGLWALAGAATLLLAGPPDFGQQELRDAIRQRGLPLTIETELNLNQPETFVATPVGATSIRVSGGDLRGLMYGLIDTADQIRANGKAARKTGEPGFRIRSVRVALGEAELTAPGFYTTDRWMKIFEMLARNRINRLTFAVPVEHAEPDRLCILSRIAHDYAVDFHLGLRSGGATPEQLRKVLDDCVLIRGIQLDAEREPVEYFRDTMFPAVQQTGRRVTLDLRGADTRPDVIRAGKVASVTLNVAAKNSTAAQDAPFYGVIAVQSAADPTGVPAQLSALASVGAAGFELDLPGPNLENYERLYSAWGRAGYDHRSPTLAPGKSEPAPAKAKAQTKTPAKSTKKK